MTISKHRGFTLVELLAGIIILSLIATMAVVSFTNTIQDKRLVAAAEDLYTEIKYIHSEAIKTRGTVYLSFQNGTNWCYGIADASACNCSTANNCQFSGVEHIVQAAQYPSATQTVNGFTTSGGITSIKIDGIRGVVDQTGSVTYQLNGKSITVNLGKMGTPQICSSTIKGYPAC